MDAGAMTAGQYVRHCLFENPTPQKRAFRRPVQDEQALTQVLGALGRSRLSSNLNQIAKAYGATHTPHVFLLDGERNIAYSGAIDDNEDPEKVGKHYLER